MALTSETLFDGTCQGSEGGSHGGGGLLEVGGAIQGGSTLEVMLLSSLITERQNYIVNMNKHHLYFKSVLGTIPEIDQIINISVLNK